MKRIRSCVVAAVCVLAFCAVPRSALACGGLFCSAAPVDQNGERVVFRVNDNNTVTAIVQINYAGAAEDFAWVVPIPSVAELETFPGQAISVLERITEPRFIPHESCAELWATPEPTPMPSPTGAPAAPPPVEVHDQRDVGPFETVTVSSEDPQALITWLRDNGYRITAAMEPFIGLYVEDEMLFLAMKLQPDQGVDAITPISMTYRGSTPSIPLRLTTVAAEPEMPVFTWIFADRRYGPQNFADVEVPNSAIRFASVWGRTNYRSEAARRIDAAGGYGFVTDVAGATAPFAEQIRDTFVNPDIPSAVEGQAALLALLEGSPYMTRLYSVISPEEMGKDPAFEATRRGGDIALERQLGPESCESLDRSQDCTFTHCGRSGACFFVEGARNSRGCACRTGAVARAVAAADFSFTTVCQDARVHFPNEGEGFRDPCETFECGAGSCVNVNGTPNCACDAGMVAVVEFDGRGNPIPSCMAPSETIPQSFYSLPLPDLEVLQRSGGLPARPGLEPVTTPRSSGSSGCHSSSVAPSLLALVGLLLRRRRR